MEELTGITVDGVPLKVNRIEDTTKEKFSETAREVQQEFTRSQHLYKTIKARYQEKPPRRQKVQHKIFEVNQANLKTNIDQALTAKEPCHALIAILFAIEKPTSLNGLFDILHENAPDRAMMQKQPALRNPIGQIIKSDLVKYLDIRPPAHGTPSLYRVHPDHRDTAPMEELLRIFETTKQKIHYGPKKPWSKKNEAKTSNSPQTPEPPRIPKTPPPKESSPTPIASFQATSQDGSSFNINVFGKIQVEFLFKFSRD